MIRIARPSFKVAAVIVSYHPGKTLVANVKAILDQAEAVLIVDNGSGANPALEEAEHLPGIEIIRNPANWGIAKALNQGFAWAKRQNVDFVLTFDQDSQALPGMTARLLDVYQHHPDAARIAVVGPNAMEPEAGNRSRHLRPRGKWRFELVSQETGWLENVTFVITSGALCRTDVYQGIGPFWEELFIDGVDIEYCLRARKAGYEVMVNCDALLQHRLGNRQRRVILGRVEYPRFHPPLRWYYISRNRIALRREYARYFPSWALYDSLNFWYGVVRMLVLEDRRLQKVKMLLRGFKDGIFSKFGSCETN